MPPLYAKYENGKLWWRGTDPLGWFYRPRQSMRLLRATFANDKSYPLAAEFVREIDAALAQYEKETPCEP